MNVGLPKNMFLAGTGGFLYMDESRRLEQRIKLERYRQFLAPNKDISKYIEPGMGESIRQAVCRAVRRFLGVRSDGGDGAGPGNIELFELEFDEWFLDSLDNFRKRIEAHRSETRHYE